MNQPFDFPPFRVVASSFNAHRVHFSPIQLRNFKNSCWFFSSVCIIISGYQHFGGKCLSHFLIDNVTCLLRHLENIIVPKPVKWTFVNTGLHDTARRLQVRLQNAGYICVITGHWRLVWSEMRAVRAR